MRNIEQAKGKKALKNLLKGLLFLLLLGGVLNSFAQANAETAAGNCVPVTISNGHFFSKTHSAPSLPEDVKYQGTERFKECVKNAPRDWGQMESYIGSPNNWDNWWERFHSESENYQKAQETLNNIKPKCSTNNSSCTKEECDAQIESLKKAVQSYLDEAVEVAKMQRDCELYIAVTSEMDFKDSEYIKACSEELESFDGKITCTTSGAETQDYPTCSKMVTAYDAAAIAKEGMKAYHEVDTISTTSELQTEMIMNQRTDIKAPLEAQKKMAEFHAEKANEMAAFDGAKLAAIGTMIAVMPTGDTLVSLCENKSGKLVDAQKNIEAKYNEIIKSISNDYSKIFTVVSSSIQVEKSFNQASESSTENNNTVTPEAFPVSEDIGQLCDNFVFSENALIQNGAALKRMKELLAMAGVDLASDLATASIMGDQADKIQDAINSLEDFKPSERTYTEQDLYMAKCQVDPSADECKLAGADAGHDMGGIGDLQLSGGGNTTIGGKGTDLTQDNNGESTGINAAGRTDNVVEKAGRAKGKKSQDNSLVDHNIAAAQMKKGSLPSGFPGGGGAGGGAAAGGGGGRQGGEKGGNNSNGIPGGGIKISGSGAGSLRMGGGNGIGQRNKKKKDNPLIDALKNARKGDKSKTLSYRGLASKDDNLFKLISKRYVEVKKGNRLHEYITSPPKK